MRFVDLFAGLGGFHLALKELGHTCVFASEIDGALRGVYKKNFGLEPLGDITKIQASEIPAHDVLCAGFPCQPFSVAGNQNGFDHPEFGGLYKDILRIIGCHRPRYLILENVPNLEKHNNQKTWQSIKQLLEELGYKISLTKLSPHDFGIPQIRQRIYIVGSTDALEDFQWPDPAPPDTKISLKSILEKNPPGARAIPDQVKRCLEIWQLFLDRVPKNEKIPHPLWSMEFGATYPYENTTPFAVTVDELRRSSGSHGVSLDGVATKDKMLDLLPSHARVEQNRFPVWKVQFIKRNREFYNRHADWLDEWISKIKVFPSSFQKLEWNCQGEKDRRINNYVIQIRASGVRVKRPTTAPSLVAMTATQVPIIPWEGRYMTPTECKQLQSMNGLEHLPEGTGKIYEALGNAVNVDIVKRVAKALFGESAKPPSEVATALLVATHGGGD